jgi:hypothetical protein
MDSSVVTAPATSSNPWGISLVIGGAWPAPEKVSYFVVDFGLNERLVSFHVHEMLLECRG